jgi:hypothetical protein
MKGGWTDIVMITEVWVTLSVMRRGWLMFATFFGGARGIGAVGRSPAKIGRFPQSRSSVGFSFQMQALPRHDKNVAAKIACVRNEFGTSLNL